MSVDLTGQRLGHYLVHEVIGRGGMSVVYRATDERLERSVALKVMSENLSTDPEFRARFLEEARAASAIDHVNVVPLYDFGEQAGALFIAMRLVDGTDLARELAVGPMPVRRVMNLLGQVGAALDMLHEKGLVHLDVKPANVLITRNESVGNEHVYLADFGLTRRGTTGHKTASGDFLGSPTYASPEHLRGQEVVPRSDEYSLTCMLFTALAGRAPFVGDVRSVISGHLSGVVPSLSALTSLPPAIDRVIARGMAVDPQLRYPTSSDLLSAARRAIASLDEEPVTPRPTGYDPRPTWTQIAAARPAPLSVPELYAPGRPHPAGQQYPSGQQYVSGQQYLSGQQYSAGEQYAAGPQYSAGPQHPAGQQYLVGPQTQVRPMDFGPDSTGRRPASHRIEPARPKWPWVALAGALVVVAAAVFFVVNRGSESRPDPSTPGVLPPLSNSAVRVTPTVATTASSTPTPTAATTASPTPTPRTTRSLLQPSVMPSGLLSVSGLPDPFTSSG